MKKTFYSILLFTGLCYAVSSCSNGAYEANPSSVANNAVDPLTPLTASQFTWSGNSPVSANINGVPWKADTAFFAIDSTGASAITAIKGSNVMIFHLANVYQVEATSPLLDSMGYHHYSQYVAFEDSTYTSGILCYSYLGNSGEILITENDSAFLKGEFYFLGANPLGTEINVTNGYFNISKLP